MGTYAPGTPQNTPPPAQAVSLAQIQANSGIAPASPNTPGTPGYNPTGGAPLATPAPTPAPDPTIASLYGSESPSDQAVDTSTGVYANIANTPVDEDAIRSNVLSSFQSEIDATNAVYAQKLKEAQIAGQGRVGSNTAISAARGELGSDFGQANADTVVSNNNDIYAGIGQEQAAAIQAITDKGNTLAQQEIEDKNTAKQQGAQDYIDFLSQQSTRQSDRTTQAAQNALSQGVDLTTLAPDKLQAIATSYNISPSALTTAYVAARNAAATLSKTLTAPVASTAGDTISTFNPATGSYDTTQGTPVDATLKEYQYAVSQGYTGSLEDFKGQNANLKTAVGIQTNPLTGVQTQYQRTGPAVAGFSSGDTSTSGSTSSVGAGIPSATTPAPTTPATLPQGQGPTPLGSTTGEGSAAPALAATPASPYTPASLPSPTSKVQLTYEKDFTSGTTATQVNALNTAVGHLFDANSIYSSINDGQFPDANAVAAYLKTAAGQSANTSYTQAATLVGDEIAGAYGADDQTARQEQAANGASTQSPAQHQAFVQTTAQLLSSKIAANVQAYRTAMGANPPSLDIFISPANQVKLSAMGISVSGLVPGLSSSSYAQSLIQNANVAKDGTVYIPVDPNNPSGAYQELK